MNALLELVQDEANWLKANRRLANTVLSSFIELAREFKAKNGRPAVLVFDNINYLAKEDPKRLWVLQQFAKKAADSSEFIIVFVCSEGNAPVQMKGERSGP